MTLQNAAEAYHKEKRLRMLYCENEKQVAQLVIVFYLL